MAEVTGWKRKKDLSESRELQSQQVSDALQLLPRSRALHALTACCVQDEVVPSLSRPDDQLCDRIRMRDVYELLHWCHLYHKDRVEKVHMVVLEGVAQLHFYTHYSQFKHLRSKYTTRCTLMPSSEDVLSELFDSDLSTLDEPSVSSSVPPTGLFCGLSPVVRRYGMRRRGLRSYLLTEQERIKQNFPVKGITHSMLKNVTTRLQDVQKKLLTLLPGNAVLVGHALDNDLRALRLVHPHVIDTSLLYRKEFGQRFKLKHLAKVILKREIQNEQRRGHDPCEDAHAALDLAHYFITTGPRQVVECHLQDLWGFDPSPVNGTSNGPVHTHPQSQLQFGHALHKAGLPALFLGQSDAMNNVSSNHLSRRHYCNSDKERPVNELTLDLDASLTELQNDKQNIQTIYVSGSLRRQRQQLLQTFSSFGPVSDITPTKDSGKCPKHTRFKFFSCDSADAALNTVVQMGNRKLNMCHALTPPHMRTWTHTNPVTTETKEGATGSDEPTFREELELLGLICGEQNSGISRPLFHTGEADLDQRSSHFTTATILISEHEPDLSDTSCVCEN
ncbi:RNA exonuclease 5 [Bagarius yarrelli]|uniref:RNA exonuclease 5 n=1 Tax=Bagarius yarrelli TaxID=175774 RepID=A0A556VAF9_BAGYA|nr:RNA exonuclease 5 [Bagarius yarrelli]